MIISPVILFTNLLCFALMKYVITFESLNRGSCMSAHVLLNLLNKLRKRDKM